MSVTRRLRQPQTGPGVHGSSISGFKTASWASSRRTASNSKGCFKAPSGLTDSEDSDNGGHESPRYSFMAPSGYTGQGPCFCHKQALNYSQSFSPGNLTYPLVVCRFQQR